MRTIVTLVLVMLIGSDGAAQAQDEAQSQRPENEQAQGQPPSREDMLMMEEAIKTEEATKDFLGLKWGAGIGVIGSFGGDDAVEKASLVEKDGKKFVRIDEEGDMRPQMFLEMHLFLNPTARNWRWYQRGKEAARMANVMKVNRSQVKDQAGNAVAPAEPAMPDPPLMGFGPFIALQSSDNEAIDALTVGFMWGARKDPKQSASVNIGLGLSFDPSVQVLGDGLEEGQETTETEVRYKKEGRFGWALMTSFTF